MKTVAMGKLREDKHKVDLGDKVESVAEVLNNIHENMMEQSREYKEQTGWESCVNSESYLELIKTYKRLLLDSKSEAVLNE